MKRVITPEQTALIKIIIMTMEFAIIAALNIPRGFITQTYSLTGLERSHKYGCFDCNEVYDCDDYGRRSVSD